MPPMATSKAGNNGEVNSALTAYYDEKTKGRQLAMVITEHFYISPEGQANPGQVSISRDQDISGLKELVDTIHRNKTYAVAQINHAGANARNGKADLEIVGPDCIDRHLQRVHELSRNEINILVKKFGDAALRAKESDYDGVEIHAAHGYLLNQFYSPLSNHRTDEYSGKTLEGRIRMIREVIQEVRSKVGDEFPVFLRLGACDYQEGGTTIEDSVDAALQFEKDGIDLIDISGGLCFYNHPFNKAPGYFGDASKAVKEAVKIPVILTGGVKTTTQAETLLQERKADLIGIGRSILKNSHWKDLPLHSS